MITCSRCGKENQDLYKFCLGCGAKLQAGAAAPAPKLVPAPDMYPPTPPPEPMQAPISVAKTAVPPPAEAFAAMGPTMMPTSVLPPSSGSGPMQGATVTPPPVVAPQQPAVAPGTSPRMPAAGSPGSGPSVQIGIDSIPMQVPARQNPLGVVPATSIPATGSRPNTAVPATAVPPAYLPPAIANPVPVPHAMLSPAQMTTPNPPMQAAHASPFSPPAVDTIACPSCGKQVASAFAFCGGCGHRMKGAPGAVAEAAIQRAEAVAPAPVRIGPRGHLTLIRPDGTEGGVCALQEGENTIGRGLGTLFDSDPYLSPRHAEFFLSESGLDVRDKRSLNGVFVRITEEEALESGDCFRIGQELLRYDAINPLTPLEDGTEIIGTPNPGYWGRLSVVVGRDLDGPAFPLFDETAKLGRERGDILFPEDGYVSGAHCELAVRDGRVYLKDLGSSNGTFLRVRESRVVHSGSLMLMGQQLFRVAYR